jgi:hypothetical protein
MQMATALLLLKKKIHHRTADDHRKYTILLLLLLLTRTSYVAFASTAENTAAEILSYAALLWNKALL